jgi:hypothetical protein
MNHAQSTSRLVDTVLSCLPRCLQALACRTIAARTNRNAPGGAMAVCPRTAIPATEGNPTRRTPRIPVNARGGRVLRRVLVTLEKCLTDRPAALHPGLDLLRSSVPRNSRSPTPQRAAADAGVGTGWERVGPEARCCRRDPEMNLGSTDSARTGG